MKVSDSCNKRTRVQDEDYDIRYRHCKTLFSLVGRGDLRSSRITKEADAKEVDAKAPGAVRSESTSLCDWHGGVSRGTLLGAQV